MSADPRTIQTQPPLPPREERKPASNDTVRREIDRLARQMGRMGEELKKLRDSL